MTHEDDGNSIEGSPDMTVTELAVRAKWPVERMIALLTKLGHQNVTPDKTFPSQEAAMYLNHVDVQRRYAVLIDTVNPPAPTHPIDEVRDACESAIMQCGNISAIFTDRDEHDRPLFIVLTKNDPAGRTDLPEHLEGYVLITKYGGEFRACVEKEKK